MIEQYCMVNAQIFSASSSDTCSNPLNVLSFSGVMSSLFNLTLGIVCKVPKCKSDDDSVVTPICADPSGIGFILTISVPNQVNSSQYFN